MSVYSLVQRLVITADETDAAGVSPKDVSLASTLKPASTFITSSIRDIRKNIFVQRGVEAFVQATSFPFTRVLGTGVDLASSHVGLQFRDSRIVTPTLRGLTARLVNVGADLEFDAAALGAAETIDATWEVIQNRQPRGATVRLLDADTVRLEWDGTLVAGEKIVASVDVFDIENLGDDIKEILFREQILLGYFGENMITDLYVYDNAGNPVTFRLRVFNSKTNREAATIDLPAGDPLQTGELARVAVVQDFAVDTNDRKSITMTLTNKAPNPDIT